MTRVAELVKDLQSILEELVQIEEESNAKWREHTDTLNVLDHELEIIPLNGPQMVKVAAYRKELRLERRQYKNAWYCSKAFNDAFQTVRVLNSMANAHKHLRRQENAGKDLIKDRGLIAKILADKPKEKKENAAPSEEAIKQVALTLEEAMGEKETKGVKEVKEVSK